MKKNLIAALLALVAISCLGTEDALAANMGDLENSLSQATAAIKQVEGKADLARYVNYLNQYVDVAGRCLNGARACTEEQINELVATLSEGARALRLKATDQTAFTTTAATQNTQTAKTAKTAQVATAQTAQTVAAKSTNIPTSLPEAGYEAIDTEETATEMPAETAEEEAAEETVVELPKTGTKDDAPVRVGLAALAGAAIMTAGAMIIRKWSRG